MTADEPSLVQFRDRPDMIDLSWGHPDPDLLPVEAVAAAAGRALSRYGPDGLGYGVASGPGPLREAIAKRLSTIDGRQPAPGELLVTNGNSQALDVISTLLIPAGSVVLVEDPTYHLALRIFRDHGIDSAAVPIDSDGVDVGTLRRTIDELRDAGRTVDFLYVIPTHHNPTGRTMTLERRGELIEAARAARITIIEDDVYRELTFDGGSPPSLWSSADGLGVIRIGSFSKTLAPGLRIGYVTADRDIIARIESSGLLDSGGGSAPFVGLVVAELMAAGTYAAHVDLLRDAYRARRDALLATLADLPPGSQVSRPTGGYFVWIQLPPGFDSRACLPAVEERGTSYLPGDLFSPSGTGRDRLRLSFSRYSPEALRSAGSRLVEGLRASR